MIGCLPLLSCETFHYSFECARRPDTRARAEAVVIIRLEIRDCQPSTRAGRPWRKLVTRKRISLSTLSMLLAIGALSIVMTRAVRAAVSGPTMSAEQALKLLLDGNQHFVAGKLEHPNQTPDRRTEVAKGQHP